ncbi:MULTISPECIES: phosphohistidine phosphatase SixA [unclassified Vibrio]|uniref:Phosphohistidine phosphatase SixA n=1 Tax=Vibrio sp. HB236076 TaxID=3232307 RepID=A0AB39HGV8_9VIBR|nr:phosphohistidine phosphatase SixA [Vibrio sp. HB161653]MDP5254757.1 phosphohistidine phosphatase SixA [Vibrio sp. HB161653]
MKIFIMRHGEAVLMANSDAERALTDQGRRDSEKVAQACVQQGISHFDKVLVSPYLRAQQTWQQTQDHFTFGEVVTCPDITPYGNADHVFDYVNALAQVEPIESLLIVSHLPLVGYLAAEFVRDLSPPMFVTSGLLCIDFQIEKQFGEVVWQLSPQSVA